MILKRQLRSFYEKFISLKGEPAEIAAGLAIGVFVGVTPTIPFHTAIIVLIGLLFRQNITAGYLGAWIVSNPLTVPFLYVSQYELGRSLLGMERSRFALPDYTLGSVTALGWEILLPLLAGGILMAPFFAVPAYFVTRRLITAIRARRK
ncbi:MAG: DUF2062 domain-containing protein [Deltaproteobacteria bacterium]